MAIIVIHGPDSLRALRSGVLDLAKIFDVDCVLTDRSPVPPFPTRRALLLTTRTPAEVARWRQESLPKSGALSAEALVFIRSSTARAMLAERGGATKPLPRQRDSESLPKSGAFGESA